MCPGNENLGALGRLAYFHHITLDTLADRIRFRRNLFGNGQDRFCFPQINIDIALFDTLDDPRDDVILTVGKFIVDDAPFGFTQPLDHDLFGCLGSDTAKILGRHIDIDDIACRIFRVQDLGHGQRNFGVFIFYRFHYRLRSQDFIIASQAV